MGKTILIVEDEPRNMTLTRDLLQDIWLRNHRGSGWQAGC